MTVGEKVASARRSLGREWTQQRLTDELKKAGLHISRGWVANLETDRVKNLASEEVAALSKVLQKPASYFQPASSVGFGHVARHGGEGLVRESPPGVDMASFAGVNAY